MLHTGGHHRSTNLCRDHWPVGACFWSCSTDGTRIYRYSSGSLWPHWSEHEFLCVVYRWGAKAEWGAEWNLFKWDAQIKKRRWGRVRDGGEQKWWPKRSRLEQMVRSCFRHHRLYTNNITTITTMSQWFSEKGLVNLLLNLLLSPSPTCCFVYRAVVNPKFLILQSDWHGQSVELEHNSDEHQAIRV